MDVICHVRCASLDASIMNALLHFQLDKLSLHPRKPSTVESFGIN